MSEHADNHATPPIVRADPPARSEPSSLSDRVRSLRLPDQSLAERRRSSWLPWLVCLMLAGATAALGYREWMRTTAESEKSAGTDDTSSGARPSAAAVVGDVVLLSKGYLVPVHQIQVSPKVGGMVQELYFKEGDVVKEGTVLAKLEDVNYRADRDRAQATLDEAQKNLNVLTKYRQQEIDQAKAKWEEADAQRVQLDIDRRRSQRLRNGSALADRDYEQADSAYQAMDRRSKYLRLDYELLVKGPRDIQIQAAQARVRQAQADLDRLQWQLDQCTIKAPVTGIILTKKAEKYNIVNPVAFNVSANLCEMADLSDLEVDLSIQEREVAKVEVGQPCVIRPEAFAGREYQGSVSRVMPVADRSKGTVAVRVKVNVPKGEEGIYLLPERSADVSFLKKKS
jgi:multidrug resistance efflux pump